MKRILFLILSAFILVSCYSKPEISDDYIYKYDEEELEEYVRYYSDDFIHEDDIDDYINDYKDEYIHKGNIEDYIDGNLDEYIHKDNIHEYVQDNLFCYIHEDQIEDYVSDHPDEIYTYIEERTDYAMTNTTQETELINIFRTLSETEKAKALLYIAELGK